MSKKPKFGFSEPEFTYNTVVPGLFQGDFPEYGVDWDKFDDVVTMTAEDIPPVRLKVGGLWMYVPIWDSSINDPVAIRETARLVAERVRSGKRVLVHCAMGLNRSGVVSARALMFMGYEPEDAIRAVRTARGAYALSNLAFVRWLYEEAGQTAPTTERWFGYDPDAEFTLPDDDDALWSGIWQAAVKAEQERKSALGEITGADEETHVA